MPSVSRAQFVSTQSSTALPVDELAGATRLRGVPVARADTNGDGLISGNAEAGALWDVMCGNDVVETTATRRLLPFLPPRTTATREGDRLAAVESFRIAALRRQRLEAAGDTFGREGVLKSGPARGEPLQTDKARPVVLLNAAQKAEACRRAGVDPATVEQAFANLSHKGAFYTTLVPKGAIKGLAVMEESFPAPVPAAHAMLRFILADDKPAILVPQSKDPKAPTLALRDLVFSAEALGQPGWKYDLLRGQQGEFGLVDRMESLEDRFRHVSSYSPPHPVEVHHLQVTPRQASAVLWEALRTSQRTGLGDAYNTLNRSCGTEAFAVLDRGIGDRVPLHVKLARAVTGERLPPLAEVYLDLRGLRSREGKAGDLYAEMAETPRLVTPRP